MSGAYWSPVISSLPASFPPLPLCDSSGLERWLMARRILLWSSQDKRLNVWREPSVREGKIKEHRQLQIQKKARGQHMSPGLHNLLKSWPAFKDREELRPKWTLIYKCSGFFTCMFEKPSGSSDPNFRYLVWSGSRFHYSTLLKTLFFASLLS